MLQQQQAAQSSTATVALSCLLYGEGRLPWHLALRLRWVTPRVCSLQDEEVWVHLNAVGVEPQFYALRWLLLMLTQVRFDAIPWG